MLSENISLSGDEVLCEYVPMEEFKGFLQQRIGIAPDTPGGVDSRWPGSRNLTWRPHSRRWYLAVNQRVNGRKSCLAASDRGRKTV